MGRLEKIKFSPIELTKTLLLADELQSNAQDGIQKPFPLKIIIIFNIKYCLIFLFKIIKIENKFLIIYYI